MFLASKDLNSSTETDSFFWCRRCPAYEGGSGASWWAIEGPLEGLGWSDAWECSEFSSQGQLGIAQW